LAAALFLFAPRIISLDIVEYLPTEQNADLQAVDNKNQSCVHIAAKRGHLVLTRHLLENCPGAGFVTMADNDGNTPLQLFAACSYINRNSLKMARLLLANGASVRVENNRGWSPLHEAAARGQLPLVREFIRHGADLLAANEDFKTPFDLVAHFDLFNQTMDYILTVAYKDQVVEQEGNRSVHAVLEAAEYRCLVVEDELSEEEESDEDEEEPAQQQQTLEIQLPIGRLTFVQFRALLRSFDGNLMRQQDNNTGAIPFHVACRTGAPVEVLELLLQEFPFAVRIADNRGSLPMHVACSADAPSRAVLQLLLEQNPTALHALDHTRALPLHCLCASKPPVDAVELLLRAYHGSITERNNNGDLPFIVACKTRASESVMLTLLRAYPDALQCMQGINTAVSNDQMTSKRLTQ